MARKPKKQSKRPKHFWVICDELTAEMWTPEGWQFPPCAALFFLSEEEAEDAYYSGPHKRLCSAIVEYEE